MCRLKTIDVFDEFGNLRSTYVNCEKDFIKQLTKECEVKGYVMVEKK